MTYAAHSTGHCRNTSTCIVDRWKCLSEERSAVTWDSPNGQAGQTKWTYLPCGRIVELRKQKLALEHTETSCTTNSCGSTQEPLRQHRVSEQGKAIVPNNLLPRYCNESDAKLHGQNIYSDSERNGHKQNATISREEAETQKSAVARETHQYTLHLIQLHSSKRRNSDLPVLLTTTYPQLI